jgi:hypothetical protein
MAGQARNAISPDCQDRTAANGANARPHGQDGLIQRTPDPADGRMSRVTLTEVAKARLPNAVAAPGNHEVLRDFMTRRPGRRPADAPDRKPRSGEGRGVARRANF